jgi:uncharacterized Zn-finger protein
MKPAVEIIPVSSLEVACDGGGGPLGHPRVFLHINPDAGMITCPYCSRTYELKLLSSKKPAPIKRI